MAKFHPLEHKVIKFLQQHELLNTKILIAYSGGLDSTVLLYILLKVSKYLQLQLAIAHIHHGGDIPYRHQAWLFAKQMAQNVQLPYFSNINSLPHNLPIELSSEAQLRNYRYQQLKKIASNNNFQVIALAHHWQDLLETRLIRLIRGTGSYGLNAMSTQLKLLKQQIIRPLLDCQHSQLIDYGQKYDCAWLDDPSNKKNDYMRNWLRNFWLPQLEKEYPGSLATLGRSLELLLQNIKIDQQWIKDIIVNNNILRNHFMLLNYLQKKQVIANYLANNSCQDYSQGQISEVVKKLTSSQKKFVIIVAKHKWLVDLQYISLQKNKG